MRVRCIKAFGMAEPGQVVDIADGAAVSPEYWEVIDGLPPPEAAAEVAAQVSGVAGRITAPRETM